MSISHIARIMGKRVGTSGNQEMLAEQAKNRLDPYHQKIEESYFGSAPLLESTVRDVFRQAWELGVKHLSLFKAEYTRASECSLSELNGDIKKLADAIGVDASPDERLLRESCLNEGWVSDSWKWLAGKFKRLSWGAITGYSIIAVLYALVSVWCYVIFKTPLSQMSALMRQFVLSPAQEVLYKVGDPEQISALQTMVKITATVGWGITTGVAGIMTWAISIFN